MSKRVLDLPEIKVALTFKDAALAGQLSSLQWQHLLGPEFYRSALASKAQAAWVLLLQKTWHAGLFFVPTGQSSKARQRLDEAVAALCQWSRPDFIAFQICFPFEVQAKVLQAWQAQGKADEPNDFVKGLTVGARFVSLPALFAIPDVGHEKFHAALHAADDTDDKHKQMQAYLKQIFDDPKSIGHNRPKFLKDPSVLQAERNAQRGRKTLAGPEQLAKLSTESELNEQRHSAESALAQAHHAQAGALLDGSALKTMQAGREAIVQDVAQALAGLQERWQKETWIGEIQSRIQDSRFRSQESGGRSQVSGGSGKELEQASGVRHQASGATDSSAPEARSLKPEASPGYSADEVLRKAKRQQSQVSTKLEPPKASEQSAPGINIQN